MVLRLCPFIPLQHSCSTIVPEQERLCPNTGCLSAHKSLNPNNRAWDGWIC